MTSLSATLKSVFLLYIKLFCFFAPLFLYGYYYQHEISIRATLYILMFNMKRPTMLFSVMMFYLCFLIITYTAISILISFIISVKNRK